MADKVAPFDAAVVMTTVLRPSLAQAMRSVYGQSGVGRLHLLVGVDQADGDRNLLDALASEAPERVRVTVLDPGYSTSIRHGGLYEAQDGGALRTVLSYLAHSRHVTYLDDDNWMAPDHVARLLAAVAGRDWAFTLRWFVDGDSGQPLAVDEWESVGPGRGVFRDRFGGFVDPNCLMLDKLACDPVLRLWPHPLLMGSRDTGMSADRRVFDALRGYRHHACTNHPTLHYRLSEHDRQPARMSYIRQWQEARQRASAVSPPT